MSALLLLGKYQLTERLGPQGALETYGAVMDVNGQQRPCIVKWLRADRIPGESYPSIAARFAAAGQRLLDRHDPSWPVVFDVTQNQQGAFLIREFVASVGLHGLLQAAHEKHPAAGLDPAVVSLVGGKLAQALNKAHKAEPPLFHLGLCPANVLVTPDGRVVVADFGLFASVRGLVDHSLDRWAFVAPELIGTDLDQLPVSASVAADLYSLGGLLYYLLSGRPPVEARSLAELSERAWEPLPALPAAPERLNAAIAALTAPDPQSRCKSTEEALALLSGAEASPRPQEPPRTAAPAEELPFAPASPPSRDRQAAKPKAAQRPKKASRSSRSAALLAGGLFLLVGSTVALLHSVRIRRSAPPPPHARMFQPSVEIPMQRFDAGEPEPPRNHTVVPAPKRTLPRVPGHLSISTTPPGADVWVDGMWKGQTPLDVTPGPGGHRVVVIAAGHRMFREVYDTTEGEIVTQELVPLDPPERGDAFVNVECRTTARFPVLVDNRETGLLCPVKMLPVTSGRHQIAVFVPLVRSTVAQEVVVASGPKPTLVRFAE